MPTHLLHLMQYHCLILLMFILNDGTCSVTMISDGVASSEPPTGRPNLSFVNKGKYFLALNLVLIDFEA